MIGSFLNCFIWRLHKKEGLWNRSYCPKCKKQITWYDNIPVLSFIALGGKCRYCHKAISWQYPIVELITGLLFAFGWQYELKNYPYEFWLDFNFMFHNLKFILQIFRDWFLIAVMIIVFIYDLRWYLILDKITLPACVIILGLNLSLGFSWQNLLIAGIIGSSFFLLQFVISRGRWIGGGDIRLGLLMGLTLGWPKVLLAIFLAYILGSVIGVGLIVTGKKKMDSQIPLGTFLALATLVVLFWGQNILDWYVGLFALYSN
jgi:prepilin signal peptidase PulO-like enzyme (type II secretory pathway)